MARLTRAFYDRDPRELAPELLNKVLVSTEAGTRVAARIVEVEAYRGSADPASHAYRGRTLRNATMFGRPGHLYLYFVYGMHWCFNAVTGREGRPAAVLVRGLEPLSGFDGPVRLDGPARLCRALDITGAQNGADLLTSELRILDAPAVPGRAVERGPRIGVDYAKEWAQAPLRFWVQGSPGVSGGRRPRPRR